jgi:hypothetical protein
VDARIWPTFVGLAATPVPQEHEPRTRHRP